MLTCRILGQRWRTLGLGRWNGSFALFVPLQCTTGMVAAVGAAAGGWRSRPSPGSSRLSSTQGFRLSSEHPANWRASPVDESSRRAA